MAHTGGTITTPGDGYTYHTFTTGGTFTPDGSVDVEYLVVGGGGAGGGSTGGGGGGGEVLSGTATLSSPTTVTVGAGGTGGSGSGANGGDSAFSGTTGTGGGGGGSNLTSSDDGAAGGNGGGGGAAYGGSPPTTGGVGDQFNGGGGANSANYGGGGGGGASEAGAAGTTVNGGDGGDGLAWLNGNTYGGGGGGSYFPNGAGAAGTGGAGGGGNGGNSGSSWIGAAGTANTGGGGGAGGNNGSSNGGSGGSGVVVVRYVSRFVDPTSLYGLELWLDADDDTTITDTAGAVSSWADKSGNGYTATTGTGSPTTDSGTIGGKNAIVFHQDGFTLPTGLASALATAGAAEVFIVLQNDEDNGATSTKLGHPFTIHGRTSIQHSHMMFSDSNLYEGFGTNSRKSTGNPSLSFTTARLYDLRTAASNYVVEVDGASHYSTGTNVVSFTGGTLASVGYIGYLPHLGGHWYGGKIGEIVVYNRVLTAAERAQVEVYLSAKWSLAVAVHYGTIAQTEEDDTSTITGEVTGSAVTGTIATTEADDTSTITGAMAAFGTIAVTEEDDTSTMAGGPVVGGTIAVTEEDDTMSIIGAAIYDVTGSVIVTEEDDTSAITAWTTVRGTINFTEEDDFVDANEDFFGIVTTNVVSRLDQANRRSRLQIPKLPDIVDPAAKKYLDTTFRYIQDEFNRLTGFHFQAIDLLADQVQAQQDLITSIIPLISINPDIPPPTGPPWNPNPTNPFNDGTYWYFHLTLCADDVTEWELQRQNLVTPVWATVLTGTTTTSPIAILASVFDDTYTYRVRWRCPGDDWTNGDPFFPSDAACATPTDVAAMDDFSNLIAYVPKVCPPSAILEAITDTPGQIGPAYGGWLVSLSRHYALTQPDVGGLVAQGLAPNAGSGTPPLRIQMRLYPNSSDFARFRVGALGVGFNLSNEDMVPAVYIRTSTGTHVLQVESATPPDVEYLLEGYYRTDTETLNLELNGTLIGTVGVAAATIAHETNAGWALVLPEGSWATDCAAWDRKGIPTPAQSIFYYTGAVQTFVVPANVTSVTIEVEGSAGADRGSQRGGHGGRVTATFSVTPGQTYNVYVGGRSTWPNGGQGGIANGTGAGGGGASFVILDTADTLGAGVTTNALIVAGSGGGAGDPDIFAPGGQGGYGGYVAGGDGTGGGTTAKGGTASAGGANGGGGEDGDTDGQGYGGDGGNSGAAAVAEGGGGGGGWHGGGATGNGTQSGGGGGGSGHVAAGGTDIVTADNVIEGDGQITFSWTELVF